MSRPTRSLALNALVAALAVATAACSPKAPAADQAATTSATTAPAQSGPVALPAACQSLLASMRSCSDDLTRKGSPLGNQIRLSMEDMSTSIAHAPPAEQSAFCDTEASAFKQRAQGAHCLP